MAVTTIVHIEENQIHGVNAHDEFIGTADDTKPDFAPENSLFLEIDTGLVYYYDGSDWVQSAPEISSEITPVTLPGDGDDEPTLDA